MLRIVFVLLIQYSVEINGHGMMLEPPNRSSLWRFDSSAPINYNDNQNFCGGRGVQWALNGGKCGVCGDNFADPHPQDNENTGKYGLGTVTRVYKSGSIIDVSVLLTANHKGTFEYSVCKLADINLPESGEECFESLLLEDGSESYNVSSTEIVVNNRVVLPENLFCERCVLRWHYRTGNNWGVCEDGSSGMGCGPQENFRSCADIAIIQNP